MSFPTKKRKMNIQVVDIHEFKDGKIVRTWHTEDRMSGLRHEPPLTVRSPDDFAILDTQYPPSFDLFGQQLVARLTPVVRL